MKGEEGCNKSGGTPTFTYPSINRMRLKDCFTIC